MRSYVSFFFRESSTAYFLYDAFGNGIHNGATKSEMKINAPLPKARALMRQSPKAFAELTGATLADLAEDTYARIDVLLNCAPSPSVDSKRYTSRISVRFSKD